MNQGSKVQPAASLPGEQRLSRTCPKCGERFPEDFNVCPRDASPLQAVAEESDPLVGMLLNNTYVVSKCIGEGGMARVYEATHRRLASKRFALKVLNHDLSRNAEVVARFQREAEAAAAISHPHVVDVYDIALTPDGRPFIVSELLDGEEVGALLQRHGKLSVPLAVYIVRQVCQAVAAAHERGVVHRDVKPENLFVIGDERAPQVKVLDFGISKVDEGLGRSLTRTGVIMGTPSYMAPEQARGEKVDHRADIYAVGSILYHLLTGKRPFDSEDPAATLTSVLTEEPKRPCELEPGLPAAVELVIQRAMAKNPDDRYISMLEFDAALEPFDTGVEASRPITIVGIGTRRADVSEAGAKTVLAASNPASVDKMGMDVRMARPTIVLVGGLGVVTGLVGIADAIGAVVRTMRGADLTNVEAIVLLVGLGVAVVTPLILLFRYVYRRVWRNSVQAVVVARVLRQTTVVALASYGTGALTIHFVEAVIRQTGRAIAWPIWSIALFVLACLGAAVAYGVGLLARRK